MSYTEKDFTRCLFNPLKKDLFKSYPRLTELIKPFDEVGREPEVRLIKYILVMYDPHSPLIKEFPDLRLRKQSAALFAGYDIIKDEKALNNIYAFVDEAFTYAVDIYLKKFAYSRLWAMIVSMEQVWWGFNNRITKPVKAEKDKEELQAYQIISTIGDEMDKLHIRLESYYAKFYLGDEDLMDAVKKITRITPESIANGKS